MSKHSRMEAGTGESDSEIFFMACRGLSCSFRNHLQMLFFFFLEWEMQAWRPSKRLSKTEGCILFARIFTQKIPLSDWAYEVRSHAVTMSQEGSGVHTSSQQEPSPTDTKQIQASLPGFSLLRRVLGGETFSTKQVGIEDSAQEEAPSLDIVFQEEKRFCESDFSDHYRLCCRVHCRKESDLMSGSVRLPLWVWSLAEWHLEAAVVALWGTEHAFHSHPFLCTLFEAETKRIVKTLTPFFWFQEYLRVLYNKKGTGLMKLGCQSLKIGSEEYARHCKEAHGRKGKGTHQTLCSQSSLEKSVLSFFIHLQKPAQLPLYWTAPASLSMIRLFSTDDTSPLQAEL